tara:strand:+ start:1844 stop:1993 length:150 start_codon:yes stop_codon:yes gene_type:complete
MMDDAAQIRALIAPWVDACLARDWDALFDICTEDAFFDPQELHELVVPI